MLTGFAEMFSGCPERGRAVHNLSILHLGVTGCAPMPPLLGSRGLPFALLYREEVKTHLKSLDRLCRNWSTVSKSFTKIRKAKISERQQTPVVMLKTRYFCPNPVFHSNTQDLFPMHILLRLSTPYFEVNVNFPLIFSLLLAWEEYAEPFDLSPVMSTIYHIRIDNEILFPGHNIVEV